MFVIGMILLKYIPFVREALALNSTLSPPLPHTLYNIQYTVVICSGIVCKNLDIFQKNIH